MKDTKIILLVIGVLIFSRSISGQPAGKIVTGEQHMIHSEIMGDDMEYWVHLPMNLEFNKSPGIESRMDKTHKLTT